MKIDKDPRVVSDRFGHHLQDANGRLVRTFANNREGLKQARMSLYRFFKGLDTPPEDPTQQEEKKMSDLEKKLEEALNETITVNTTSDNNPDSQDSVTITANGEDAAELMQMLKLAGINQTAEEQPEMTNPTMADMIQIIPLDDAEEEVEEDLANTPNDAMDLEGDVDTMVNAISGGLNRKKNAYAKAQDGDNAMAVKEDEKLDEISKQKIKDYMDKVRDSMGDDPTTRDYNDQFEKRMKGLDTAGKKLSRMNPFSLYDNHPDFDAANKELSAVVNKAKKMDDKKQAMYMIGKVQEKYRDVGAMDTEVSQIIRDMMEEFGMNESVEEDLTQRYLREFDEFKVTQTDDGVEVEKKGEFSVTIGADMPEKEFSDEEKAMADELFDLELEQQELDSENYVDEDALDENAFNMAAAQAAVDGKKEFEFGGKMHKVTMDKETAQKLIDESVMEDDVEEGLRIVKHPRKPKIDDETNEDEEDALEKEMSEELEADEEVVAEGEEGCPCCGGGECNCKPDCPDCDCNKEVDEMKEDKELDSIKRLAGI